jgi:hypothetical protein
VGRDPYRIAERILLPLGGAVIGAALFWMTSWEIDPKITLGDLFIGLITVILAWVVSVLIERGKSSNSALNSLLLQRVEEIRILFRDSHAFSQQQAGNVWSEQLGNEILVRLRSISLLLADLEGLTGQIYETDLIARTKQHYIQYKQIVTNTGPSTPLTLDRMTDADAVYRDIRKALTNIIVEVCRR